MHAVESRSPENQINLSRNEAYETVKFNNKAIPMKPNNAYESVLNSEV